MRLGIMQPYFFPYLGYFQLIQAVDKFILYDNLNYIKNGWINRNRFLLKGTGVYAHTVAVRSTSCFKKIREVRIDQSVNWRDKFLALLQYNYKKCPYYAEVYPVIEQAICQEAEYVGELNVTTIQAVTAYLGITTEITADIAQYEPFEQAIADRDGELFRAFQNEMGVADTATVRILYICRNERADTYINPIGGQAIYYTADFAKNAVDLKFVQTTFTPYPQSIAEFIPQLSIVDVMMNCGREGTRRLLNDYTLISGVEQRGANNQNIWEGPKREQMQCA